MESAELFESVKTEFCMTSDEGTSDSVGFVIPLAGDQPKPVKKEEPVEEGCFYGGPSSPVGCDLTTDQPTEGVQRNLIKEEPEEDELLYCVDCRSSFIKKCEAHGPALFISDTPVHLGIADCAVQSLPPSLEVRKSDILHAGLGVFNNFGPCQGDRVDRKEAMISGYSWAMPREKSRNAGKGKAKARKKPTRSPSPPSASGDSGAEQAVPEAVAVLEVPETHDDPQEEALCVLEETPAKAAFPGPSHSSVSSQSTHKSSKSKKKPKKSCRLQNEQEESRILEWVEEHPCLWNLKNRDFKNKARKDRLWKDKANELGYDVESLKTWYTDLRDWNTKLHGQRSGDRQKEFTDRERWVMDRFMFLRSTIRHRRVPEKSLKKTLAVASRDLDEEERATIPAADEDVGEGPTAAEEPATSSKPKKQKKDVEDPVLAEMRKKIADAQAELRSVKHALTAAEPVTERTAFLDWVRQVCKNASDDQFTEFQTNFIQMQARWKLHDKQQQQQRLTEMSLCASTSSSTESYSPPTLECGGFQSMPSQWRMMPPSPWQS